MVNRDLMLADYSITSASKAVARQDKKIVGNDRVRRSKTAMARQTQLKARRFTEKDLGKT